MKRSGLAALAALVLGAGLVACGDDEDGEGGSAGSTATFEMTGSGKNLKLTGPETVQAGPVKVEFKNSAKGEEHGLQLIRIEGRSAAEGLKAAEAWGDKGRPLPDWIKIDGGTGFVRSGRATTATVPLEAGDYIAVDVDTNTRTEFTVEGSSEGELPEADGVVTAADYRFEGSGLKAGKQTVELDNVGKEPHFFVAMPIRRGKTIDDVRDYARTEKGASPVEEEKAISSPVIDGRRKQLVEVELQKGKYAFLCFIPDRAGGPPHVAKGMVSELTVE